MKRKIVFLMVLILITFTSSAYATNWLYYDRFDDGVIGCNWYIDVDSVVKDRSKLIFWKWSVYDMPTSMENKKMMMKYEASLRTPMQFRVLETHHYDKANKEVEWAKSTTPENWQPVTEKDFELEINIALKFAKEGKDTGKQPTVR